jgi:hypothetical protein
MLLIDKMKDLAIVVRVLAQKENFVHVTARHSQATFVQVAKLLVLENATFFTNEATVLLSWLTCGLSFYRDNQGSWARIVIQKIAKERVFASW